MEALLPCGLVALWIRRRAPSSPPKQAHASRPAGRDLRYNEIVVIPEDAFRYNTALEQLCVGLDGGSFHGGGGEGPRRRAPS